MKKVKFPLGVLLCAVLVLGYAFVFMFMLGLRYERDGLRKLLVKEKELERGLSQTNSLLLAKIAKLEADLNIAKLSQVPVAQVQAMPAKKAVQPQAVRVPAKPAKKEAQADKGTQGNRGIIFQRKTAR